MAKTTKKAAETTDTTKAFVKATYSFGATAIQGDRKAGLSWAKIAEKRDLGSPGAARTAWKNLVGTHHSEAPQLEKGGRPAGNGNGGTWMPVELADITTIAALRKAIGGLVVRVQPITKSGKPRQFLAEKVAKLSKGENPEFELTDASGATHTVRLDKVDATRVASNDA